MFEYYNKLINLGHTPIIHPDYISFINGDKLDILKQIKDKEHYKAKKEQGYIKWYYNEIQNSDAILVLNLDKNNIKNYIGGNTLMEIGFAYVNNKKIFLLNDIPENISYFDEIKAMCEVILYNDLKKIS